MSYRLDPIKDVSAQEGPGVVTDMVSLARVAPMRMATSLATTEAAMDRLPRDGRGTSAAPRWLANDSAEAEDRNQLLAEANQRRQAGPADVFIAARLHWRAIALKPLKNSDNAYGSGRWFQRPGMGRQAPQNPLTSAWNPGNGAILPIFELVQTALPGILPR